MNSPSPSLKNRENRQERQPTPDVNPRQNRQVVINAQNGRRKNQRRGHGRQPKPINLRSISASIINVVDRIRNLSALPSHELREKINEDIATLINNLDMLVVKTSGMLPYNGSNNEEPKPVVQNPQVVNTLMTSTAVMIGETSAPNNTTSVTTYKKEIKIMIPHFVNCDVIGFFIGHHGTTISLMEQETGCKLMIRGRGSMKNTEFENYLREQYSFSHLHEDLHIVARATGTFESVNYKLAKASTAVQEKLQTLASQFNTPEMSVQYMIYPCNTFEF